MDAPGCTFLASTECSRTYYIMGTHLATEHFNSRSNDVIPDLSERLDGCDLYLTMEYRDTQYSRFEGARHVSEMLQRWPRNTVREPFPSALVGAGRSDVSETVSSLSAMFRMVQVSPHSSAASLDDKSRFPLFARTTPSNAADAKAAADYFAHLGATHLASIYILDSNGIAYNSALQKESTVRGMAVLSVPYLHTEGGEGMRPALSRLRGTNMRFIFAVVEPTTWKQFIAVAIEEGVIGNSNYFWLFHSGEYPELDRILSQFPYNSSIHSAKTLPQY